MFPPPDAADPERLPGFVGVLGPDGPLAYATNVRITETDDAAGTTQRASRIRARGPSLDVQLQFDVASTMTTRRCTQGSALANGIDFLQMRGRYTVDGRAGHATLTFSAPERPRRFAAGRTEPPASRSTLSTKS